MTYYRFARDSNPMSDWGHAIMADSMDRIENCYGENCFTYDGEGAVSIEDLRDEIASKWDEQREDGTFEGNMITQDYLLEITGEELFEAFNPEDIVDTAQAWDNDDMVQWFYDNVLQDGDTFKAVITRDGAVVFDASLLKMIRK